MTRKKMTRSSPVEWLVTKDLYMKYVVFQLFLNWRKFQGGEALEKLQIRLVY